MTCFTWNNVVTPRTHHTLTFRQDHPEVACSDPNPLSVLEELGLLPFIKKVKFDNTVYHEAWVEPKNFDPRSLHNFSTLMNLQDLKIDGHPGQGARCDRHPTPRVVMRQIYTHQVPSGSGDGEDYDCCAWKIQFTSMELDALLEMQPFFEACAENLQTLHLHLDHMLSLCKLFPKMPRHLN